MNLDRQTSTTHRSLRKELAKYTAIVRAQLSDRLAYAGDLALQSLSILMYLWIFMQIWRVVYSSTGQSSIAGYTLSDTLWYLMVAEVIVLSSPRIHRAISDAVKDGSIAYLLCKPTDFLLFHLSSSLGSLLPRLFFNFLFGGILVWWMVGPPPSLIAIPFLCVAFIFSWLIDFCFSALIGLAAFATEEVAPFQWIYSKMMMIAGGLLIPLDFYPEWLRRICLALPFAYTVYGPASLLSNPSLQRFVVLSLGQLAWIIFGGFILIVVYRRGIRSLAINGG